MPQIKTRPVGLSGIIRTSGGIFEGVNIAADCQVIPIDEILIKADTETVTAGAVGMLLKVSVDEWRIFKNRVNKAVREAKKATGK